MNYRNRLVLPLLTGSLSFLPLLLGTATVFAQGSHPIRDVRDAALNSVDICKRNAGNFIKEDKSLLLVTSSKCAELTHSIFAALREAKYSPKSFNLHNRSDFNKFIKGAVSMIGKNERCRSAIANSMQFFSDSTVKEVLQRSIGAYLLLDYGIDLSKF
jgi:hypothetical protein